jgi:tetratricopeptide (TPR) repeat protein
VTAAAAREARPRSRAWTLLAAAALAVVAVIAADALRHAPAPEASAPPLDPASLRPGFGPATFGDALAAADRAVAARRDALERHPGEWLAIETLARALMVRHRLTASPGDLAEAGRLLDSAFALAPWPAGPALTGAQVALARHDLEAAERALARFDASAVPASADEQAEARSIRCEIAFQRGRVARARELCGGTDGLASPLRLANLAARTGDPGEAERIVEAQLRQPRLAPQTLATLALQRASLALAQGDWEASSAWTQAAERAFPGYWLAEAFAAQQLALEGRRDEAIERYAALAERTGDPDVLDALARLAEAGGRTEEARAWAARAGTAWEQRARLLPLTYAAHHAEHLLLNADERRAVGLAAADHRRRPYPGTIVHYAYALWRTGAPAQALAVVRAGEAQGFRTAEMKLVEALALGALGRAAEAGEALGEARRLNPRIDSPGQRFVAFGRD